jgi:hypothetical protein
MKRKKQIKSRMLICVVKKGTLTSVLLGAIEKIIE